MANWKELSNDMKEFLQLDSNIIAVKRLEKKKGLQTSPGLKNLNLHSPTASCPTLSESRGKPSASQRMMQPPWQKKCSLDTAACGSRAWPLPMKSRSTMKRKRSPGSGLTIKWLSPCLRTVWNGRLKALKP